MDILGDYNINKGGQKDNFEIIFYGSKLYSSSNSNMWGNFLVGSADVFINNNLNLHGSMFIGEDVNKADNHIYIIDSPEIKGIIYAPQSIFNQVTLNRGDIMKERLGLTLIEVIISIAMISVISVVVLGVFHNGIINIVDSGDRTKEVLEIKKEMDKKIKNNENEDGMNDHIIINIPGVGEKVSP